jgi:hypothetical protein
MKRDTDCAALHRVRTLVFCFLAAVTILPAAAQAQRRGEDAVSPLELGVLDDGKQIKLRVNHRGIGPVCELWCYEGGPFRYGTAVRRADGTVVFSHRSGNLAAKTTFAPVGEDRVSMDVVVDGGEDGLKKLQLLGPCMQFWHSEAFSRRDSLAEFAGRCFLYTVRGPVGMLDTARGPMKSYKPDAPENTPPFTQWYVPIGAPHPGDIWAFGASGDRPVRDLVGVVSRDGKWLAAIGCSRTRTLGQGWHDCIHHVVDMQKYFDPAGRRIAHRSMIYVMPNDKRRLLESFQADFPSSPEAAGMSVSPGARGLTVVAGPRGAAAPELSFDVPGAGDGRWQASPWGGFVRPGTAARLWAYPHDGILEFWITARGGMLRAADTLEGRGWTPVRPPAEIPALVRQSPDGDWTAALLWERSEPSTPTPAETSTRGRLFVYRGGLDALRDRAAESDVQWQHAKPYRMPLRGDSAPARSGSVRFAPNAEADMTYGLTIIPPWPDGGTLHANFPEHFEYGDVGYGILRHHNKVPYPWKIAPDGRSASFEVESPELPGAIVRASAVADGDTARLTLELTNRSGKKLERVKPLLCFWYARLAGFPGMRSDNFEHTYVVLDGKPVPLASIPTSNPAATAKVAYIRGCTQRDCDKFALSRGGLIGRDIDRALIVVEARDGKRKVVIAFAPGKSILSNAFIPCAHADPLFGTVENGASVEASGEVLFTEDSLTGIVQKFMGPVRAGRRSR